MKSNIDGTRSTTNENKLVKRTIYNESNVCAIIVTFNIGRGLFKCFESIKHQVDEVVIVDNNSNAETIQVLNEFEKLSNVNIVYNKENRGIAAALNQGVNYAIENNYDWVITLDHDSEATENMIEKMLTIYKSLDTDMKKNVGIICPQVYDINSHTYLTNDTYANNEGYAEVKNAIQSGCIIKTSVFNKIGLFYEPLFIYFVDDDFCRRLLINRFKILRSKSVTLYHEEGKKKRKRFIYKHMFYSNYNSIATYYIARNCIYMIKRYDIKYIKRVITDFIKILLFDDDKGNKAKHVISGIYDGITNKFGKM